MTKFFLFQLIVFFISINSFAQTKSTKIIVDGVCMMCEERIEKNIIGLKGVKLANWNLENRILKLVYNEKKISLDEIHKFLASIGHDTNKEIASNQAYNLLDPCCQYRDVQVVKDHGLDRKPIHGSNKKEQ
jgi:copper chaperone CopZ|tara:strand:+ start:1245 stop:1637 length:393 start_codon:yes stop_codon:yes gene_type:complete